MRSSELVSAHPQVASQLLVEQQREPVARDPV